MENADFASDVSQKIDGSFSKDMGVLLIQNLVTELEGQLANGAVVNPTDTQNRIRELLRNLGREDEGILPGEQDVDTASDQDDLPVLEQEDEQNGAYGDEEGEEGDRQEEEEEEEYQIPVSSIAAAAASTKVPPKKIASPPKVHTQSEFGSQHISWGERVAMFAPEIEVTQGTFGLPEKPKLQEEKAILREAADDWNAVDGESENRDSRIRQMKVQILRSLQRTLGGPRVLAERGLSLKTPLIELQFEEQQKSDDDAENDTMVSVKEWCRIIFSAIEGGNKRFGPILELTGWSGHLSDEIERFDRPFRQIYRRFFSKRVSSPGVEIAWIFFGSLVMYHMTGKLGGRHARPTPSRDHAGARRAASMANSTNAANDDDLYEEEDMPPPPPTTKRSAREKSQQQSPDIASLLGGLLGGGGGGGQPGLAGLNIGSILGMLGGANGKK